VVAAAAAAGHRLRAEANAVHTNTVYIRYLRTSPLFIFPPSHQPQNHRMSTTTLGPVKCPINTVPGIIASAFLLVNSPAGAYLRMALNPPTRPS
jgi:hypothetical protein